MKLPQASKVEYFGNTYLPNISEKSTESSDKVLKLPQASKNVDGAVDLVQSAGVETTANSTSEGCYQLQDLSRQPGNVSADQDQSNCAAVMPRDGGGAEPTVGVEPTVLDLFLHGER